MTKIDTSREAIEKILEGVTPGPWDWSSRGFVGPVSTEDDQSFGMIGDVVAKCNFSGGAMEYNANFIAAARELVPALLAEREAAEVERDRFWQANLRLINERDRLRAEMDAIRHDFNDCVINLSGGDYAALAKHADGSIAEYNEGDRIFTDGRNIDAKGLFILSRAEMVKKMRSAYEAGLSASEEWLDETIRAMKGGA